VFVRVLSPPHPSPLVRAVIVASYSQDGACTYRVQAFDPQIGGLGRVRRTGASHVTAGWISDMEIVNGEDLAPVPTALGYLGPVDVCVLICMLVGGVGVAVHMCRTGMRQAKVH